MRSVFVMIGAAALGSCAMTDSQPVQPAASARTVAWLLGGKVAGAPQTCLSRSGSGDMTVIDSQTIAFRESGYRTSLVHLTPGCGALANGGTLVTTNSIGGSLCRNDIAQVAESGGRFIIGSCSVALIVPYITPRR